MRSRSALYPSATTAAVVDALMELSAAGPSSLRQLSRRLRVPHSTLHRVLTTLCLKGIVQHADAHGYSIAPGLLDLVSRNRMRDLPRVAQSLMRRLHRETGETINLAIPQEDSMLIIAAVHSEERLRMVTDVGSHDYLHASSLGKAYLAALQRDEAVRILERIPFQKLTDNSITNIEAFLRALDESSARGFAVDDEESVSGVRCVGVAILSTTGNPLGALSIAGPMSRITDAVIPTMGAKLRDAAASMLVMMA